MRNYEILLILVFTATPGIPLSAQNTDLVPVIAKPISQTVRLPAEIHPFLDIALHAKVTGYVERVLVDRGSVVKQGDLLVELSAPEMQAQLSEAESKIHFAEAERIQADAQLEAAQSTLQRLSEASATPGAIAGNDLIQAQKQVDAIKAVVTARQQASAGARAAADSLRRMISYLKIDAPFDGIVTDRLVHPGALVWPPTNPALLVLQQVSHLRVVIPVPEEIVGSLVTGTRVHFSVPAYPQRIFSGTIARIARTLNQTTRTMPVELDVTNRDGALAPGMYPSVEWPVQSAGAVLLVPKTSIVTTTERTFVVRNQNGHAEWVDVKATASNGDMVGIIGNLKPGDLIVRRATDEIRAGEILHSSTK
jgi:membrane fusion protein, multidrug efflux system